MADRVPGSQAAIDGYDQSSRVSRTLADAGHPLEAANAIMTGKPDEDYDVLIDFLNGELKQVLAEQTRDELAQMYLKLIASQPRLVMLGAKALLKSNLSLSGRIKKQPGVLQGNQASASTPGGD